MRSITSKPLLLITCMTLLSIVFFGCKKSEIKTQSLSADALAKFKEQIRKEGQVTTYFVNKKATAYTSDANGDPITTKLLGTNKLLGECYDEDDLPLDFDEITLQSVRKLYDCANGYKITVVWKIIAPFTLNASSTNGRFRIKNTGGTIIYPTSTPPSYVNVSPVTITSLPTDPSYPSSYVYEVQYTSAFIPQTHFDNGYTLENFAVINTECGFKTISPLATYGLFIGTVETLPCDRVDKVYINPGIQSIAGSDVGGTCYVSGYTHANRHEVQYRAAGTTAWTTINFPVAVPYINYYDAWMVSLPSGTLEFRYRNQMASPACNGPWSEIETYSW